MTSTVGDFGEYMDAHGVITIEGSPVLDIEYDVKWKTTFVEVERPGQSAKTLPTKKRTVTTKIKKAALATGDPAILLGYGMTATPSTGSTTVVKAATAITADSVVAFTTSPATPSQIRGTLSVGAITTAGKIIVYGTDVNDNTIEDVLTIPLGATIAATFTTQKVFKTTTHYVVIDVASTNSTEIAFAGIGGTATFTFGNVKVFDIVGTWTHPDATSSIIITQPKCMVENGGLSISSAKPIPVDIDVRMYDPDDLTIAAV